MQLTYLILCLLGFALPYSQFILFIAENGLNLPLFWSQLFINQISSFCALDLFVSSVVFWIFLFQEGTRLKIKCLWIYLVFNLTIGLSFALPLFLWKRFRLRLAYGSPSLGYAQSPSTQIPGAKS